jgi:putative hydrolase of the HAD superfamily
MTTPDLIADLTERIRRLSQPMEPVPTDVSSRLRPVAGIRAVLFDVYGTLLVSGTGDIGVLEKAQTNTLLRDALKGAGVPCDAKRAGREGDKLLLEAIQEEHASLRENGVEHPEVDIYSMWKNVLAKLREMKLVTDDVPGTTVRQLAVEYECRVNPVWPAPGVRDVLERLHERGIVQGIVSNAQFYTPLLFNALLGDSPDHLGFDPALCVWSYMLREAKPSRRLFERALDLLEERHEISPAETLYVGNDMLNDIMPAASLGCRTVLFAGDQRSLRMRADDQRCAGVEPDAVVTDLREIMELLGPPALDTRHLTLDTPSR